MGTSTWYAPPPGVSSADLVKVSDANGVTVYKNRRTGDTYTGRNTGKLVADGRGGTIGEVAWSCSGKCGAQTGGKPPVVTQTGTKPPVGTQTAGSQSGGGKPPTATPGMAGFTAGQGTGGGSKPPSAVDILQGVASIIGAIGGAAGSPSPGGVQLAGDPSVAEPPSAPTIVSDADPPGPSDYIRPGQGIRSDQGVEVADGGATAFVAGVAASLIAAGLYEGGKAMYQHYYPTKEQLQEDIGALGELIPKAERQVQVLQASEQEAKKRIADGKPIRNEWGVDVSQQALGEIRGRLEAAKDNLKKYQSDLGQKTRALEQLRHPDPPPQW